MNTKSQHLTLDYRVYTIKRWRVNTQLIWRFKKCTIWYGIQDMQKIQWQGVFLYKAYLCTIPVLFMTLCHFLSESFQLSSLLVSLSFTQFSQFMHWETSVHFIVPLKQEQKPDLHPFLHEHEISSKSCWGAGSSLIHSILIVFFSLLTIQPCPFGVGGGCWPWSAYLHTAAW